MFKRFLMVFFISISIFLSSFILPPSAEALIAEVEKRPVAFALFFQNYSTFLGKPGLYLEDLWQSGRAPWKVWN